MATMIEVRMNTSMSGDPTCLPGDIIKVEPKTAERWEALGVCEIVRQTKQASRSKATKKFADET